MTGIDDIIAVLRQYRFVCNNEAELQVGIAKALAEHGIVFHREHSLGASDRIDFFVPGGGIGIEVKCAGGPSAVLRQCLGYAQHDCIRSLLLVTSRLRLSLPDELNGKPTRTLSLWLQGF